MIDLPRREGRSIPPVARRLASGPLLGSTFVSNLCDGPFYAGLAQRQSPGLPGRSGFNSLGRLILCARWLNVKAPTVIRSEMWGSSPRPGSAFRRILQWVIQQLSPSLSANTNRNSIIGKPYLTGALPASTLRKIEAREGAGERSVKGRSDPMIGSIKTQGSRGLAGIVITRGSK